MPRGLPLTLRVLDWAMLIYWSIMALAAFGLLTLPASAMYDGYGTAQMDAWNWSFAPLDLIFALTGLASVHMASWGDSRWKMMALISLSLTFCAGLMAIGYWAIIGDFNASWWIPNLLLMIVPLYWIPRLFNDREPG